MPQGVAPEAAADIALAARGSVEPGPAAARRRRLRGAPAALARVPTRLDGTGATAARLAAELLASAEQAVEPLRARHQAEMEALVARAEATGERGVAGRKDIEDRLNREERRWRADELRAGLGVLAAAYRDRLVTEVTAARPADRSDGGADPGAVGRRRLRRGRLPRDGPQPRAESLMLRPSSSASRRHRLNQATATSASLHALTRSVRTIGCPARPVAPDVRQLTLQVERQRRGRHRLLRHVRHRSMRCGRPRSRLTTGLPAGPGRHPLGV